MANPVAAHTFDFIRVYLSTRDAAAPGSGTWSNPVKLFDGWSDPGASVHGKAATFSAGALTGDLSEPRGIVANDGESGSASLMFLGNGLPDLPKAISWGGSLSVASVDYWDISQGAWTPTNGALYLAGVNDSVFPNKILILKSTDNGTTWNAIDATHAPQTNAMGAMQRIDDVMYFFSTNSVGTDYFISKFDCATDLWTTPIATLTAPPINDFGRTPNSWSNGLFVFLNGDFAVIYDSSDSGSPAYRLFNGSWQAEVPLPGAIYANCVIDPSLELIHIWAYGSFGGSARGSAVHYSTVAHNGTVTPDIFIIPATVGGSIDGVGKCSIQNSMLYCPRDDEADFDNAVWVALLSDGQFQKELLPIPPGETDEISSVSVANGGSGYAPSNFITVNGGINPCELQVGTVAAAGAVQSFTGSGGTGYSTASNVATTTGGGQPGIGTGFRVNITSVSGGAITGVTIHSLGSGYANGDTGFISGGGGNATYTITAVYAGGAVLTLTAIDINGGGYAVASGVATTTVSGVGTGLTVNILSVSGKIPSCAYMMFPNGYSLTSPLSLACPIDGGTAQVGIPYSAFLVATGGVPPYTFAIIGGSLPPGLTLNSSTGEISGTPTTAGTYTYTAQVTDSLGATAEITCQITIPSNELTIACPVSGTGTVGVPYLGMIMVTGGTPPYHYELI